MDSLVLDRFQSLRLETEEDLGFHLEKEDVQLSIDECNRSLIGKVFGDKAANFTGLKNSLAVLWSSVQPFITRELGVNLFQFIFASEQDKQRVLCGKAWTFDSQFLILKPWVANMDFTTVSFNTVPIWIQIWNIPHHWMSKATGSKFHHIFGHIKDVLLSESGSKLGRHIKILVDLKLDKPLLRGTRLKFDGHEAWVNFKYENLASFCYYCGHVGHNERSCTKRSQAVTVGRIFEGQYGDWLRASPIRRQGATSPTPTPTSLTTPTTQPPPVSKTPTSPSLPATQPPPILLPPSVWLMLPLLLHLVLLVSIHSHLLVSCPLLKQFFQTCNLCSLQRVPRRTHCVLTTLLLITSLGPMWTWPAQKLFLS